MIEERFEWDDAKAAANLTKHGDSFNEAKSVFDDPAALTRFDTDHSEDEDRFITLGSSISSGLLLVVYTSRLNTRVSSVVEKHPLPRNVPITEVAKTMRDDYGSEFWEKAMRGKPSDAVRQLQARRGRTAQLAADVTPFFETDEQVNNALRDHIRRQGETGTQSKSA